MMVKKNIRMKKYQSIKEDIEKKKYEINYK